MPSFWALADETPMENSKTGQPAAAFRERVAIIEEIDSDIVADVRDASTDLDSKVSNDDVIDAFILAIAASPSTKPLQSLPSGDPDVDPEGLTMEIVFPGGL